MSDAPFSARRKGGYVVPSSYHPSHLHFARLAASNSGGPCALDDARTPRLAGLRQRRQHSLKVTGNEVWSQQIILATVASSTCHCFIHCPLTWHIPRGS
jgi:hypothetical protein